MGCRILISRIVLILIIRDLCAMGWANVEVWDAIFGDVEYGWLEVLICKAVSWKSENENNQSLLILKRKLKPPRPALWDFLAEVPEVLEKISFARKWYFVRFHIIVKSGVQKGGLRKFRNEYLSISTTRESCETLRVKKKYSLEKRFQVESKSGLMGGGLTWPGPAAYDFPI